MAGWKERLERIFAAVAFAEQAQRDEALKVAGLQEVQGDFSLESVFVAATYAEANCYEMAREQIGLRNKEFSSNPSDFASVVGLRGVRIWYGVVELAA